jgi:hypothetical protein
MGMDHMLLQSNKASPLVWFEHGYLTSHTSHVLQLLNVSCFKPFKSTLKGKTFKPTNMEKIEHSNSKLEEEN